MIYETPYSEGEKVRNGDIVLAKFVNQGETYYANRFFTSKNKKEYFDEEGNNMQKAFLRAPLDFAYISSHFNPNISLGSSSIAIKLFSDFDILLVPSRPSKIGTVRTT